MSLTETGMTLRQPLLRVASSQRVPLVKLDTVIAHRGESADTIYAQVDDGTLRWVFNVASNPAGEIRDLRFWAKEVHAFCTSPNFHAPLRDLAPATVVNEILGARQQFHSGELCLLLSIRRPTLKQLRAELGGAVAAAAFIPRAGVQAFLLRRLVN